MTAQSKIVGIRGNISAIEFTSFMTENIVAVDPQ
jgi:hypothetical protein